jgi:UDP-N-acetylglucosamine 3-dehydrogenase
MVKKINLAVVGSGYWGSKLTGEYMHVHEENPDFNFRGVIDNDQEKLEGLRKKYRLESSKLFSNIDQCLADPSVNAIHIATPMETHCELACDALSKHKHILLEKPMATNARDAFEIAMMAEKNGSVVLVGHIFRFNAALSRAKELIERNAIGSVKSLTFNWLDYLNYSR